MSKTIKRMWLYCYECEQEYYQLVNTKYTFRCIQCGTLLYEPPTSLRTCATQIVMMLISFFLIFVDVFIYNNLTIIGIFGIVIGILVPVFGLITMIDEAT